VPDRQPRTSTRWNYILRWKIVTITSTRAVVAKERCNQVQLLRCVTGHLTFSKIDPPYSYKRRVEAMALCMLSCSIIYNGGSAFFTAYLSVVQTRRSLRLLLLPLRAPERDFQAYLQRIFTNDMRVAPTH